MILEECLLKVICAQHVSEKVSTVMKKNNSIVLRVVKNANKSEIKDAVYKLFKVKVSNVRTLIMKGKTKRYKQCNGRRNDWKKAYVTLKKGQNLDFISGEARGLG